MKDEEFMSLNEIERKYTNRKRVFEPYGTGFLQCNIVCTLLEVYGYVSNDWSATCIPTEQMPSTEYILQPKLHRLSKIRRSFIEQFMKAHDGELRYILAEYFKIEAEYEQQYEVFKMQYLSKPTIISRIMRGMDVHEYDIRKEYRNDFTERFRKHLLAS